MAVPFYVFLFKGVGIILYYARLPNRKGLESQCEKQRLDMYVYTRTYNDGLQQLTLDVRIYVEAIVFSFVTDELLIRRQ